MMNKLDSHRGAHNMDPYGTRQTRKRTARAYLDLDQVWSKMKQRWTRQRTHTQIEFILSLCHSKSVLKRGLLGKRSRSMMSRKSSGLQWMLMNSPFCPYQYTINPYKSDIILLKLTRYDIHEQVQSHSLNRHLVFVTALKPLIKSPTVSLLLGPHPKGSVKPGKLSSRPCPNLSHDLGHSAKRLKQNSSGLLVRSILFNHFTHKILGVAMHI